MKHLNKLSIAIVMVFVSLSCSQVVFDKTSQQKLPRDGSWGIYSLDLETQDVELHYSSPNEITNFSLSPDMARIAFAQKDAGGGDRSILQRAG